MELIGKHLGMFKDREADDTVRETLDKLVALFASRNESGDGNIIDVSPNEQRTSPVRTLVQGSCE